MFNIERYRPFRGITRPGLMEDFEDSISRFFGEPFFATRSGQNWVPSSDVVEAEDKIQIMLDLPGVTKDQIDIQLNNNTLVVRGEIKFEEKENVKYHRMERFYGSFTRSFVLPTTVNSEKIAATFKDGVLTIDLPKAETAKARRISIKS